jgi:hypothetical protein
VAVKSRAAFNGVVVLLLSLGAGGLLYLGILKEQLGEVLFNATLV